MERKGALLDSNANRVIRLGSGTAYSLLAHGHNILVVILMTIIPWLLFFLTTMSSELLDDNVVTHMMCMENLNLLDDSVVTYDERVV